MRMARESSTSRGHGDGKADPFPQEGESSGEEETIENVEREVKRELSVRVKDCSSLLKQGRKVVVEMPQKVPGINRLKAKTPRKIKTRKAEVKHRHENPTPKVKHQKKSTGGTGYYHRIRNTPSPEERSSCQEKMVEIVGRHQTKGKIPGKPQHNLAPQACLMTELLLRR